MKKFIVLAFVVFTVIAGTKLFAQDDFQASREWNKLAPEVQQAWIAGQKSGDLSGELECFMVLTENGSPDRDLMFGAGFYAQVVTGTVVRGHTYVKNLPDVAKLYFVRKIKLAQ